MKIREPKFNVGDKVIDDYDDIYTVAKINGYSFLGDEYFYNLKNSEKTGVKEESDLEPYPKNAWELQDGDECFFITAIGNVFSRTWDGSYCTLRNMEIGNVFLTKEEAEYELERREIEAEMLRLGGRREFKKGERNWYIFYDFHNDYIDDYYNMHASYGRGMIYFDSEEKAEEAVEIIGKDRIKKYIFGVE